MTGEDLYREVKCRRCGKMKLKSAGFCPHCGYVQKEHWWDRLLDRFRISPSSESARPTRIAVASTMIGVALASFFLYNAIQKQSLQSLILAILTLIFAFRSWFATRGRVEDAGSETPTTHLPDDFDVLEDNFFCENCGTRVNQNTETCPKCGMKFG